MLHGLTHQVREHQDRRVECVALDTSWSRLRMRLLLPGAAQRMSCVRPAALPIPVLLPTLRCGSFRLSALAATCATSSGSSTAHTTGSPSGAAPPPRTPWTCRGCQQAPPFVYSVSAAHRAVGILYKVLLPKAVFLFDFHFGRGKNQQQSCQRMRAAQTLTSHTPCSPPGGGVDFRSLARRLERVGAGRVLLPGAAD